MYKKKALVLKMRIQFKNLYKWAYHKFYMDGLSLCHQKIIFRFISVPLAWFDRHIVDGTMNGIAGLIQFIAHTIKGLSRKASAICFRFLLPDRWLVLIYVYYCKKIIK
jgi:NADH-quinone oxidoreductase subunit L